MSLPWRRVEGEGDEPATVEADRDALVSYLNDHDVVPAADATVEQLQAQALVLEAAAHARFLETYQPVITRLPGAVGTTPEQPEPADDQSGGAQPVELDAPSEPAGPVEPVQAPSPLQSPGEDVTPPLGASETGTDEQPQP